MNELLPSPRELIPLTPESSTKTEKVNYLIWSDTPSNQLKRAQKIKENLENSKIFIVIGDKVLTTCISQIIFKNMNKKYSVSSYATILL